MSQGSSGHNTKDLEPKGDGYKALFVFAFVIFILCVYSCFENDSNIEPNEDYIDRVIRERRVRVPAVNPPVPSYCLERVVTEMFADNIRGNNSHSDVSPILATESVNLIDHNIEHPTPRQILPSAPSPPDTVSSDLPSYNEVMNQLFDSHQNLHSAEMPCPSYRQSSRPSSLYVSSQPSSPNQTSQDQHRRLSYTHQSSELPTISNITQDIDLPSYGEAMALLASKQSNRL